MDRVEQEAEADNKIQQYSVLFDPALIEIEKRLQIEERKAQETKEKEAIRALEQ